MRKITLILALLLLAVPAATSQEATPLDMREAGLSVKVSNIINIEPRTSNYQVESLNARLSWVPRDSYRQEVKTAATEPESEMIGDELKFEWSYPQERELWIKVSSSVTTRADYKRVNSRVEFPVRDLPAEMSKYLQERNIINFNEDIERKASELAEGEDDMYEVVVKLATWVNNNINYSLDTLTADASKSSSWVLENRRGVCDEMTSLFISMARSLGIPARFVYGQAYTNVEGVYDDNWGPHGWAEVYFPGHGWVPFDPTYAEYGYVDAGHVKMGESLDANRPSLKYTMKGRDADVSSGFLDITSQIVRSGGKISPEVSVEVTPRYSETGFGSYNLITATLENDDNYYKPVEIRLAAPPEVIVDRDSRSVLLEPGEEEEAHWLVEVPETLNQGYIYTFPFRVSTTREAEAEATFKTSKSGTVYGKNVFREEMEERKAESRYSDEMDFYCAAESRDIYLEDTAIIACSLENTGTRDLGAVSVCRESECREVALEGGTNESVQFTKDFENPGVKNVVITARQGDVRKTSYAKVNVLDESDIGVEVDAPEAVRYGKSMHVKFTLTRQSVSTPENVKVRLGFQGSHQEWDISELENPEEFDVSVETDGFTFTNEFTVTVEYEDALGRRYLEEEKVVVEVKDLSVLDWLKVAMNTLGYEMLSFLT